MKRIVMLKSERGSEEQSGTVQEYHKDQEYTVSDNLAKAFQSTSSCKVLSDPEADELLGKSEPKDKLKNK